MAEELENLKDEPGTEDIKDLTQPEDHSDAEDGDDDEHEDRLLSAESDDERDDIREARRKERKARNARRKEAEERLRSELRARDEVIAQMQNDLNQLKQRGQGADMAQLDVGMKQASDAYAYYKKQMELGTTAQNGAAVADAAEKMFQAKAKFDQLNGYKQAVVQRAQQPQPLDPRVRSYGEAWIDRNKWYDPSAKDEDSAIAKVIDERLFAEGWNPATEEYWKELDRRVKNRLPHRQDQGYNQSNRQRSPVGGSSRDDASGSRSEFKLSADRVQALKEAGMWDDTEKRNKMIKRYQQMDREAKGA